jgi:hypothetical protein
MQRRAVAGLADHPYRLELVGTLRALTWPSVCASCGAGTGDLLTVRKAFRRPKVASSRRHGVTRMKIVAAQIPYCPSCAERHRALTPPRSATRDLLRLFINPMIIALLGSGYFFVLTLRIALGTPADDQNLKYVWGMPALFAGICLWTLAITWWDGRVERMEKQSDVTRACDFSDDVSWFWERERRIYAMQNQSFAQALADANRDRVWNEDDDRRSGRRMLAGMAVVGVVGAAVWLFVVFVP